MMPFKFKYNLIIYLIIIRKIHYIYIALFSALNALYIEGGISSTTTFR